MTLRLIALALLLAALPAAALARQNDDAPTSPCCGVDISPQLPVWDAAHGAWRDADAQVPHAVDAAEPGAANTITVTATVLPSRSVTVEPSGMMRIVGNSTGPAWWSFTVDDKRVELSQRLWTRVAQCMREASAERDTICTLSAPAG